MGQINTMEASPHQDIRSQILQAEFNNLYNFQQLIYRQITVDKSHHKDYDTKDYLKEFIQNRRNELENVQLQKNNGQMMQIQLKKCFLSMLLLSYCSDPILWREVPQPKVRNIMVIGNIGNGKSTLLNKLALLLTPQQTKLENDFFAA